MVELTRRKPKRKVAETPSPTEDKLYEQIYHMAEPYRSYAAFLYLFGNRVSEGIGIKVGKQRITEPIRAWDFVEEEGVLIVKNTRVFKRAGRPYKDKYVIADDVTEQRFTSILVYYLYDKPGETILWDFDRTTFYRKLRDATGLFPHKLRGMRATKDVSHYDLNIIQLKDKHGWTTDKMPMLYVSLAGGDVLKKMKQNAKRSPQT